MTNIAALLLLLSLSLGCSTEINLRTIIREMNVGSDIDFVFNRTVEYIIIIPMSSAAGIEPLRIEVECKQCNKEYPALIIIKQVKAVTSFRLPDIVQVYNGQVSYNKVARTLCPHKIKSYDWEQDAETPKTNVSVLEDEGSVIVSLSTRSEKNVTVNMMTMQVVDFTLQLNENRTIHLTPSTPYLYGYNFLRDGNTSILLKVESDTDSCMEITIYNESCPLDGSSTSPRNFYYQTATELGGVTITSEKFPLGFMAMFSLLPDDSQCLRAPSNATERSKTVTISVGEALAEKYYFKAILVTVAVAILIYTIILSASFFYFMRKDISVPELEDEPFQVQEPSTSAIVMDVGNLAKSPSLLSPEMEDTLSMTTASSLDDSDVDILTDATFDKNIIRSKTVLRLNDLCKRKPTQLKRRSNLYFWGLATVSVFYAVPAGQLVGIYQYNLEQYGNQDICYFNSLCSHPWGVLMDFNHFFSNLGYVAFGILFIVLTFRKERVHKELVAQDKRLDLHYGVPQHFGLFHAMGTSLVLEGVMSACYHICPNADNFQFDVTFMYIISTLCMVKIYQSRHPDINATAYTTYFIMASVLGVVILGLVSGTSSLFWGIFIFLHVVVCCYISVHIYYVGTRPWNIPVMIRYWKECRWRDRIWPVYPARFALIAIMNLFNMALDVGAIVLGIVDFMSFLLSIFIVNLMLYTTFYIIMKLISRERILLQPFLYIMLALASWIVALYYFYHKTISWKQTPAESKRLNKPCELMDFYDNHDIWHFISSAGLFFSFMVLLTLDDDLIFVNRCKIAVF